MCLGAMDFEKVRKIKSVLNKTITELVTEHRDVLCKDPGSDFTRCRDFTPEKIISLLLRFGSKSAESELIDLMDCDKTSRNINSAFLQQRKKLGDGCMPWLFEHFTDTVMKAASPGIGSRLFRGRHLLACDGSDVNIAYNPSDEPTYVAHGSKKGYNQIHLNALCDICTGSWVSANVQGIHEKQERRALVSMVSRLRDAENSIIVADRGYESFNVFAACMEAGTSFVVRLKDISSNGILSAYDLEDGEFDTYITTKLTRRRTRETLEHPETYTILPRSTDFDFFDDNDASYEINVRIVRFRLPNGSYVAVATNLDPEEFDILAIAEIYRLRWGCETGFRKLKYSIGLVAFHSWKMEYILQELYARLIMFNFCAFIVNVLEPHEDAASTDEDHASAPRIKKGIAFSQAVTVCRKLLVENTLLFIKNAAATIKAHIFESKRGRSNPRKVKPQSSRPFLYRAG